MPIIVTMETPHESDRPGTGGGGNDPEQDHAPDTASDQEGITPERLTKVIRRLESGFYDSPEVRERIARRVRKELDS